jgi:hypothetical protein
MEICHMLCVGRKKNLNFPVVGDMLLNYDHITLNFVFSVNLLFGPTNLSVKKLIY